MTIDSNLTRHVETGRELAVAMIHQGCEPLRRFDRCDAPLPQGIADHTMQRAVPMVDRHALIQRDQISRVAARSQILDHTVFELDSHGTRCGVDRDIVAAGIF